jgi:CheY-like chemotaxis protein
MDKVEPAILVIDDDAPLGESIVAMLSLIGYRATWVSNLRDAVARLAPAHDFSAILLDLGLGIERGEQLVERCSEHNIGLPPIVIFSAQPEAEIREAARTVHAKGFLMKPTSSQRIKRALDSAMAA